LTLAEEVVSEKENCWKGRGGRELSEGVVLDDQRTGEKCLVHASIDPFGQQDEKRSARREGWGKLAG